MGYTTTFKGELRVTGEITSTMLAKLWTLTIGKDGLAKRVDVPILGKVVKCPDCGTSFEVDQ